jgi:hypothetical protein
MKLSKDRLPIVNITCMERVAPWLGICNPYVKGDGIDGPFGPTTAQCMSYSTLQENVVFLTQNAVAHETCVR